MEPPAKKTKKSYTTWNNAERHILLQKRVEQDLWFTGKNANSNTGWKNIARELSEQLGDGKDAVACKTQWNALMKKYKAFFTYRTGEGTGEEATAEEAKDWEFFDEIHAYAAKKDNYHPPFLIDSRNGIYSERPRQESDLGFVPINTDDISSTSRASLREDYTPSPSSSGGTPKTKTDYQRLEKHVLRRDRKIGKKISSLLCVFGQMVQTDYPHIDASGLLLSSESDSD